MPVGSPLVNLQVKTSAETFREFENAYGESECNTKGQFLESIIEAYLNPPKGKTVEVSKQEDQDTIQNLTNEIGRLKIEIDLKDEKMKELYEDSSKDLDKKLELIRELEAQQAALVIPINQHIITIPPIIKKVLDIESVTAKKKTGKDFSIEEILLNSFWDSVVIGRVSPFRQWSSGELSNLAKQLQSEAQ